MAVIPETQDGQQKPAEIAFRLKLEGGRITEAEHMVVRNLRDTQLANLQGVRLPLVTPVEDRFRDSRSRVLAAAASYYDALDQNNGSLAPFADDCVRIENRRVMIADEVTGMAFGLSHFRHAFEKREFAVYGIPGQTVRTMDNQPFDMPAIHLYKIWGGTIHEIEAVGIVAPYNSPTG